tara:strand:+ start:85 stop:774 length:690 start_codon:yes stop_codon:yes gene_type:complete
MEKKKRMRNINILKKSYLEDSDKFEIGVDEAGRGPMLGRVYSAAVVLPSNDTFRYDLMKDSKKFHSTRKIEEAANYIKEHALYWSVEYETEQCIDKINIRNATHSAMHKAIKNVVSTTTDNSMFFLLIDGNDFKPYLGFTENKGYTQISHTCIEGGDNKYASIAAASILAKVERDKYIHEICEKSPYLDERYDLLKNKGYGTKKHLEGIKEYGISEHHRKTFGICREYS